MLSRQNIFLVPFFHKIVKRFYMTYISHHINSKPTKQLWCKKEFSLKFRFRSLCTDSSSNIELMFWWKIVAFFKFLCKLPWQAPLLKSWKEYSGLAYFLSLISWKDTGQYVMSTSKFEIKVFSLKSFGNSWWNSYTKFIILAITFFIICGKLDLY